MNFGAGYYKADWYVFSENAKYLDVGASYKFNDTFWLSTNLNFVTASGPNDPYNDSMGKNPNKSNHFILGISIQKYFNLTNKLNISGRIGPFVNFVNYYSHYLNDLTKEYEYHKKNDLYVGAMISPEINYEISDKFTIGINSNFTFEMGYGYSGFYIGPKVEYYIK